VLAVQLKAAECAISCTPVPDNATVVGELVALLTTLTLPARLPEEAGAKVTLRVTAWLGVKVVPEVTPLALKLAPEAATLERVTFEFPVLVRLVLSELLLPKFTLPKLKLVGFAVSRKVAVTPVPLRAITSGELGALLTSETAPVTLPAALGVKSALNVALLPAAMVSGTVIPVRLKPLPDAVAWEIVTPALPALDSLIVWELLVPVTTLPKLALEGVAASCG